jgi:hypothetical protein
MDQQWIAFAGIVVALQAIAAFLVILAAWFLRREIAAWFRRATQRRGDR